MFWGWRWEKLSKKSTSGEIPLDLHIKATINEGSERIQIKSLILNQLRLIVTDDDLVAFDPEGIIFKEVRDILKQDAEFNKRFREANSESGEQRHGGKGETQGL